MFAAPAPPAGRTLSEDTLCRRCGYNLRTLLESGNCPECATPVALSLRGDLLKFADPAWVRVLALGASLVTYAIGAMLIAFIVTMISIMAGFPMDFLLTIVAPAAGIAILVGQWLLTKPDPTADARQDRTTASVFVRWLLLAALVIAGIKQSAPLLGPVMSHPGVIFVMSVVVEAMMACWVIAYSRHLAWLYDRIPDVKRAKTCRQIGPILAVLGILVWVRQFIPGIGVPGAWAAGQSRIMIFLDMFLAFLNLVLLVCVIRGLLLNSTIAKLLRAEAKKAAANWSVTPK